MSPTSPVNQHVTCQLTSPVNQQVICQSTRHLYHLSIDTSTVTCQSTSHLSIDTSPISPANQHVTCQLTQVNDATCRLSTSA